MYLHIGQDQVLPNRKIVGIFDLDTSSLSKKTRETLAKAQKDHRVTNIGPDLPKSFIITTDNRYYLSQLSTATLRLRAVSPE